MGFFDKLTGASGKMKKEQPLSYYAKQVNRTFHDATCDICGSSFQWLDQGVPYPVPLSVSRSKPDRSLLDIGGWCPKCKRMICPGQAEFVPYTLRGDDFWAPGCRDCQEPLQGLHIRAMYMARLAEHRAVHDDP